MKGLFPSMRFNISGAALPADFPYAIAFNAEGQARDIPPLLVGAIGWRETLSVMTGPQATVYIAFDGGHGIMQLTSSWPDNWQSPAANIAYAIDNFIAPQLNYWHGVYGYSGDALVKLVADSYNEGPSAALAYHNAGNADEGTTGHNYGSAVLANYYALLRGQLPGPLPT